MSNLYQGQFDPNTNKTYKVSRTKIEFFLECKRCFYMDRRLKISRPKGFPFNLNSAVDNLLKNEFDSYREKQEKHPLQIKHEIDAIPFKHEKIDEWRENFKGVSFLHQKTNLHIFGAVDDLWINSKKELIVVDYKATSKKEKITALDQDWQDVYKRQMDVYTWILRQNGFKVSDTGYFLYCNGLKDKEAFNKILEFEISLIPYKSNDSWIENTLVDLKKCLMSESIPQKKSSCEYCQYLEKAR